MWWFVCIWDSTWEIPLENCMWEPLDPSRHWIENGPHAYVLDLPCDMNIDRVNILDDLYPYDSNLELIPMPTNNFLASIDPTSASHIGSHSSSAVDTYIKRIDAILEHHIWHAVSCSMLLGSVADHQTSNNTWIVEDELCPVIQYRHAYSTWSGHSQLGSIDAWHVCLVPMCVSVWGLSHLVSCLFPFVYAVFPL